MFFDLESLAQKIYKDSINNLTFELSVDSVRHLDSSGYSYFIRNIKIFRGKEVLQSIPIDSAEAEWFNDTMEDRMLFVIEDVNFDGHNDIRLLNYLSLRYDTEYRYWFYNDQSALFVEDTTLINVMDPEFNQQKKLICSSYRSGSSYYGCKKYS